MLIDEFRGIINQIIDDHVEILLRLMFRNFLICDFDRSLSSCGIVRHFVIYDLQDFP